MRVKPTYPKGFEPGSHGCHEALHMATVIGVLVDNMLAEHPSIRANPRWLKQAEKASDALARLYQMIGREHL